MERKCAYCGEDLSDRGNFCKACGNLSACRECNEPIEAGSNYCVVCGTDLRLAGGSTGTPFLSNAPVNTFEFSETKTSRSAKATLTNESVASLQNTLSLIVSRYPLGPAARGIDNTRPEHNGELFPDGYDDESVEKIIDVKPRSLASSSDGTVDKISRLFYEDEGKLSLEVQDLKASSQKDFGVRLVYLRLLYSKEVKREEFVGRDELNATLKEVMGMLDPNVISWITSSNDLSLKDDNGKWLVRFKADGHTKALKVLNEVYDEELKGEFTLEKRLKSGTKAGAQKGESKTATGKSPKKSKSQTELDTWVNKWKELNLNIDLQGIAKPLGRTDRVLVALWLIHKVTEGKSDTAITRRIAPLLNELFFVPASRQNLDAALKDGYKDMLLRTPEGWRITPEGLNKAQNFVDDFSKPGGKSK